MKPLLCIALFSCLAGAALPASAIDRVTLRAGSVTFADLPARDVTAILSIQSERNGNLSLHAAEVTLPAALASQLGPQISLKVDCTNPVIHEPVFDCPALTLQLWTRRWPPITLHTSMAWRSDSGTVNARGTGPELAGSPVRFDAAMKGDGTRARLDLPSVELSGLVALIKPWVTLPEDLQISGRGNLSAVLERTSTGQSATLALTVKQAGMQNAASTWIGEKIEATLHARVDLSHPERGLGLELDATGTHGQVLAGPVLLDFDHNPLDLKAVGTWDKEVLRITRLESSQRDLLVATGNAEIAIAPLQLRNAEITASEITFPAAYSSYMQLFLATTPFNQLATQGKAHAVLRVRDGQPVQLTLVVDDLAFDDAARAMRVTGVRGELHWSAGETGPPQPSFVSWKSARGWGIEGAESRIDFVTSDRDFRILKQARLPFFDGALLINTLTVEHLGQTDMAGKFDAVVEPISVAPIAKALHWPEFAGKLSGRVPGLTYRDGVLTLDGDLEADVFDGQVVASNLRVRDPLGKWPRLYADVLAFNLDLELVTRTFEFGTITGRVDVDLKQLETFNWSPVAFDLRIATPKDDKSPHRISQRAVANLSNIGGGGGGVATALQSGALQFFETFRYDQIGLSCRLRNDVCQMSGVGSAGDGYYILRGAGLPHLDIIGRSTRVDWPRFVSQLTYGINNSDSIVVK